MGILNIIEVQSIPKLVNKFNAISIKISTGSFMEFDNLNLRFVRKFKDQEQLRQS